MHQNEHGFTLLEIIIVVAILGIVSLLLVNRVSSSAASRFESEQIRQVNTLVYEEITQVWRTTGAPANTLQTNPILVQGNSWMDVVMFGKQYISDEYQSYYINHINNGVGELIQVTKAPTAGATGEYAVLGYPILITSREDSGLTITYKEVDVQLIDSVSKRYNEPEYNSIDKKDFNDEIQYNTDNDLSLVVAPVIQ